MPARTDLRGRLSRLECALGTSTCTYAASLALSWPGAEAEPYCPACGGERLVVAFPARPSDEATAATLRSLIGKALAAWRRLDLSVLSNEELAQVRAAPSSLGHAPSRRASR